MNTGGYGNDSLMTVVVIVISIGVGVILFGGPTEAAEAVNALLRGIVYHVTELVSALA